MNITFQKETYPDTFWFIYAGLHIVGTITITRNKQYAVCQSVGDRLETKHDTLAEAKKYAKKMFVPNNKG